jgi:hypothetical protein
MSQHGTNKISMEKYKKPSMELLHQALEIHSLFIAIIPRFSSDHLLPNSSDSKVFDKAILDFFEKIIQITSLLLGSCLKFSHTSSERVVRLLSLVSPYLMRLAENFSILVKTFSKYFANFQIPESHEFVFCLVGEDLVSHSFARGGTCCSIISE